MTLLLIPVFTALTVLALAAGVYHLRFRNVSSARLQRLVRGDDALALEGAALDMELGHGSIPFYLRPIAFLGFVLPNLMFSETLKLQLAQAGFRHPDSRAVYAGVRVITTAGLSLLAIVIALPLSLKSNEMALLVATAAAVGFFAPAMFLSSRQSRRQTEITLSLPDALDLLVICVEAGQGLNAALMKVGKEVAFSSKALSEDLMLVNNEMRAGVSRTQALRNLSLRTGVDDVRSLVAVMIQSDRFGTSVGQALRIHSDSLRTRRRQRAEERARKAPIKLLFPLVFCIFPELLVVILAPGMLELFRALSQH